MLALEFVMPPPDRTSKERVYAELRRSIMVGQRLPGERLSVETLAKQYGTSITPIRDALQMLSEAELVTIKPRSGYFVAQITLKQLTDLLELYEILELASIERAVARITDDQIDELEKIHEHGICVDADRHYQSVEQNRQFHDVIAQASGNQEIVTALSRVHNRLARFLVICSAGDAIHSAHVQIMDALRTHDQAAGRQAMLSELNAIRTTILDHVIQTEGSSWFLFHSPPS